MTNVPFLDLSAQYADVRGEVDAAMRDVVAHSQFVLGPAVQRFESMFAEYVGAEHCVAVSSGTSALHLALAALDIGPGDEVITSPLTWVSTTWAISYCGATPVFADVDQATGNLDVEAVSESITSATKAILSVDLYGNPADLVRLQAVAQNNGLSLIDDAAQAHGARLDGKTVGSFGDVSCFSFYPTKNLGAFGEAGAVVTNTEGVAARITRLRDHAQAGRHNHLEIGFNYRMDGIQGAVLAAKLPFLDKWNAARRSLALNYNAAFSKTEGIEIPTETRGAISSWHLYVVRLEDRKRFAEALRSQGIETGYHYPTPVHLQPAYLSLGYRRGDFPVAEEWARRCLSLPMYPHLTSANQQIVTAGVERILAER